MTTVRTTKVSHDSLSIRSAFAYRTSILIGAPIDINVQVDETAQRRPPQVIRQPDKAKPDREDRSGENASGKPLKNTPHPESNRSRYVRLVDDLLKTCLLLLRILDLTETVRRDQNTVSLGEQNSDLANDILRLIVVSI